jgi:outer membrane protein OmpA-like peptidoglycan-associated protein
VRLGSLAPALALFLLAAPLFAANPPLDGQLARFHPVAGKHGIALKLGPNLFASGGQHLPSAARHKLARLAAFMLAHEQYRLIVNGYTDSVGKAAYNKLLSEARAEAVAGVIERQGVKSARMTTHGYGETHPVASNKTKAGRAKNRRVTLILNRQ